MMPRAGRRLAREVVADLPRRVVAGHPEVQMSGMGGWGYRDLI